MKSSKQNHFLRTGMRLCLILALQGIGLTTASAENAQASAAKQDTVEVKNVIFLIGDGMGLAQVSGAMASSEAPLAFERAQTIGLIRTSSSSHYVTDSAAAGTALSSGQKTYNGAIGLNADGEAIPSMLAYATQEGKGTGIVVTSSITHATPASFYAHNTTRRDEPGIAQDFPASGVDVAIGGGRKFFENREDGVVLTDQLKEEVLSVEPGRSLIALLANNALPKATEGRGPVLAQATAKALELLSANPNGFVLVVEGSQIDWGGHNNEWEYALAETIDFSDTINVAMDYADAHPGTLVVITADHETGGLSLVGGNLAEHRVEPNWAVKKHTATMLPVYAYGTGSERFAGIYENTEVFDRILSSLGIPQEPAPQVTKRPKPAEEAN
jgi:alkaline phosphatase